MLRTSIVACLILAGVSGWLWAFGVTQQVAIEPGQIGQEQGHAFIFALPENPLPALITFRPNTSETPRRTEARLMENGNALGDPWGLHSTIRHQGNGRFSYWHNWIYFSTSDNSDPRVNGRRYHVRRTLYLRGAWAIPWALIFIGLLAVDTYRARQRGFRSIPGRVHAAVSTTVELLGIRSIVRDFMPGVLVSIVVVVVFFAVGEAYFRITTPFSMPKWPFRFDSSIGFRFEPNAVVRWTNNLDFWVEEKTNSLGFLDREPSPLLDSPDHCNVTVLGDSMVEAAQVRNDQKFHVLLERMATESLPRLKILTQAFGFSGTGQLNQIPFHDVLARPTKPNVLVLVFVGNDLSNNSAVLEAIRNGWHPRITPRLFARHLADGSIRLQPISREWEKHQLEPAPTSPTTKINRWDTWARDKSQFYRWISVKLARLFPKLATRVLGTTPYDDMLRHRLEQIRAIDGIGSMFLDWDISEEVNLDGPFNRGTLPRVFSDGMAYTRFALSEFQRRAIAQGFHLVALISSDIEENSLYLRRTINALEDYEIPYLVQAEFLREHRYSPPEARFKHDGHWSPKGHQWAAQQLLEWIRGNPDVCKVPQSGRN